METLETIQNNLSKEQAHLTKLTLIFRMGALAGELLEAREKQDKELIKEICGFFGVCCCQLSTSIGFPVPYGPHRLSEENLNKVFDEDVLLGFQIYMGRLFKDFSNQIAFISVATDESVKQSRVLAHFHLGHVLYYLDALVKENNKHENILILVNDAVKPGKPKNEKTE